MVIGNFFVNFSDLVNRRRSFKTTILDTHRQLGSSSFAYYHRRSVRVRGGSDVTHTADVSSVWVCFILKCIHFTFIFHAWRALDSRPGVVPYSQPYSKFTSQVCFS